MLTIGQQIDEALAAAADRVRGTMDENVVEGCGDDIKAALPDLWCAKGPILVEHEFGYGGNIPVSFDVAPDTGRVYFRPGDKVWIQRKG